MDCSAPPREGASRPASSTPPADPGRAHRSSVPSSKRAPSNSSTATSIPRAEQGGRLAPIIRPARSTCAAVKRFQSSNRCGPSRTCAPSMQPAHRIQVARATGDAVDPVPGPPAGRRQRHALELDPRLNQASWRARSRAGPSGPPRASRPRRDARAGRLLEHQRHPNTGAPPHRPPRDADPEHASAGDRAPQRPATLERPPPVKTRPRVADRARRRRAPSPCAPRSPRRGCAPAPDQRDASPTPTPHVGHADGGVVHRERPRDAPAAHEHSAPVPRRQSRPPSSSPAGPRSASRAGLPGAAVADARPLPTSPHVHDARAHRHHGLELGCSRRGSGAMP